VIEQFGQLATNPQSDALLLEREPCSQGLVQLGADGPLVLAGGRGRGAVSGGRPLSQVHDLDHWKLSARDPIRQAKQPVLPRLGVHPALERRRRASQHDYGARRVRPHDRDLAGVVPGRLALLVARLVLLVHDDGAQIAHRREHG
jgi:hypothetical protein